MKKLILSFVLIFQLLNLQLVAQPTTINADRLAYIDEAIQVLSFSNDPNENRLFVLCHNGKIWVYENGEILPEPFLDLGADGMDILDFGIGSEEGLNGMVLDPDYDENGFFYLMYNGWKPDGTGVNIYDEHLICFKRDTNDEYKADITQNAVLMTIEMPRRGHNAGTMGFGPDGYLYVSIGDGGSTGNGTPGGGSGGDVDNNAQNLNTVLGKILRLDVNGLDPYTIPPTNPFVGVTDTRPEIWAYGFRNPWRWSFDRLTGDKFIGDVGEVDWEEVSFEPAESQGGLNFGWRLMEGTHCYEPVVDCNPNGDLVLPVYDYPHANGLCSVIGGYVYRGSTIPTLNGYYIFTDFCGFEEVKFMTLKQEVDGWSFSPINIDVEGGFILFEEAKYGWGQDNRGELYLCTSIAIYRLASDPNAPVVGKPESLVFSPNPAEGLTMMDLGTNASIEWMEVFDPTGKLVSNPKISSTNLPGFRLDVSHYNSGIYTVRVKCTNADELLTGRLVIINN